MENRTKGERDGLLVRTSGGERTQSLASRYSLLLTHSLCCLLNRVFISIYFSLDYVITTFSIIKKKKVITTFRLYTIISQVNFIMKHNLCRIYLIRTISMIYVLIKYSLNFISFPTSIQVHVDSISLLDLPNYTLIWFVRL
jgi:hypothetical protein